MKLYNTLTRQIDDIKPLRAPEVSIYTCGPTVYDYPHIGNWFTFVRYDLLVRVLRASGLTPKWVMNITDVGHLVSDADEGEDKLEKGAKREGKTAWDIANFYTDYFVRALEQLNFTQPDYLPRATEHIREQIDLVKRLEEKGFTYTIDDGVYYDTSKFEHYANFAKLDLDDQQAGARVAVNQQKRNQSDFALWKFSPKDHQRDMEWDSPWGKGFPGWHLECSAMAFKYLGETLDIHSGGIDHIPVHHTNEIAQSEAASGKPFAHYWMHANHVLVEGEKIAKSLDNGITLEQVEAKGYDLETLRLYILESHYRTQSQFSWEGLAAAKSRLTSYQNMAAQVWQPNKTSNVEAQIINQVQAEIKTALENDLNTPAALERLSFLDDRVNASGIAPDAVSAMQAFLQWVDDALGLRLSQVADISDEQKQILSAREAARKEQDWAEADKLRDKLAELGIGVRDTAWGQVWIRL
ncbi:MAG TPA: cysteine--tRNA ligase [Patescibacteria group bacterium]|nr:cysteine--tRNA ligase [Patescibacteria group bacterium]